MSDEKEAEKKVVYRQSKKKTSKKKVLSKPAPVEVKPTPVEKPVEVKPTLVSFTSWWLKMQRKREKVGKKRVPDYFKEIVWADFDSRGGKKEETTERYNELFELFGYEK